MDRGDRWHDANIEGIRDMAKKNKKPVHLGRVFEICVEKGSEFKKGDKRRKYKGRTVIQGNLFKDQNMTAAIFEELGSSPATLQAMKCAHAYGLFPGHTIQQADARQAYTQTTLGGDTETWVRLPKERWPAHWHGKYRDPVVRLVLALYGHPGSGGWLARRVFDNAHPPRLPTRHRVS